jgi:hypothetical protein
MLQTAHGEDIDQKRPKRPAGLLAARLPAAGKFLTGGAPFFGHPFRRRDVNAFIRPGPQLLERGQLHTDDVTFPDVPIPAFPGHSNKLIDTALETTPQYFRQELAANIQAQLAPRMTVYGFWAAAVKRRQETRLQVFCHRLIPEL